MVDQLESTKNLLRTSMQAAVGLRLLEWAVHPHRKPDPWEQVPCRECNGKGGGKGGACHTCGGKEGEGKWLPRHEALAQMIATHGDCLMFKTPGLTAETFNALSESIALMAYVPGGVTFLGDHYEVPSTNTPARDWTRRLRKVLQEYPRIRKVR